MKIGYKVCKLYYDYSLDGHTLDSMPLSNSKTNIAIFETKQEAINYINKQTTEATKDIVILEVYNPSNLA